MDRDRARATGSESDEEARANVRPGVVAPHHKVHRVLRASASRSSSSPFQTSSSSESGAPIAGPVVGASVPGGTFTFVVPAIPHCQTLQSENQAVPVYPAGLDGGQEGESSELRFGSYCAGQGMQSKMGARMVSSQ